MEIRSINKMDGRKQYCIDRLLKKLNCWDEIRQFFLEEKLADHETIKQCAGKDDKNRSRFIYVWLRDHDDVQLWTLDWELLPREMIRLTIVTKMSSKEFVYEQVEE